MSLRIGGDNVTALEPKWNDLWKTFEAVRKAEWLKTDQATNYNKMVKEASGMATLLKAIDKNEQELLDACGNRKGKTYAEVPLYLKTYIAKLGILKKGDLKQLAQTSYADMDKVTKPKTYRALKVLMTGIQEIVTLGEYSEKTLINAAKDAGKTVSSQERIQQVQDIALSQVKKAVAKSLALIQKNKADLTRAGWTDLMNGGGTRDVIMGLTALAAAQAKGGFANVPAAGPLKATANPWNVAQTMAKLELTDGPVEIAAKLKAWSVVVKSIAVAYSAHW